MDLLQLREGEIFETLKKIRNFNFVLIGGYAVNCYTLPRFSVDCDIVVDNAEEAAKIGKEIEKIGYAREAAGKLSAYHAEFMRYEKKIKEILSSKNNPGKLLATIRSHIRDTKKKKIEFGNYKNPNRIN